MKTLQKLNIKSEKLMKNEELVSLRGGYGYIVTGTCAAESPSGDHHCGISKTEAIFMATCNDTVNGTDCNGGSWCCDSCETTDWWIDYCK